MVLFSFRHLRVNDGFPINTCEVEWFVDFLLRLRDLSSMAAQDVRQAGKALRAHQITWEETTRPEGFAFADEQLNGCMPYQFHIAKSKGRVHGFWSGSIFYVVWIDRHHALYGGNEAA